MERIDVKTKAAAEKAVKAGKPIRIVAGAFALSFTGLSVNIEVAPEADIAIKLTDCGSWSSRAVLRGSSRAVLRGSSRAELWGSSSAVLRGSSRAELWGSSRAELWGSSSAVLRGSSRAVLRESSRAEAFGYSFAQVHSANVTIRAADTVCVNLWNGASCDGGRQQIVNLATAEDWCGYYGARIEDGCAILYKAVGAGYISARGASYQPGTMPFDEQWDGRRIECAAGGGLSWSPTPRHTHRFVTSPAHYLEARVRLEDMVLHWGGQFPEKVCSRTVAAPLVEVDVDGNPVAVPA